MPKKGGIMRRRRAWVQRGCIAVCLLALAIGFGCDREPTLSLQGRIDAAESGATITIEPGTYLESLRIDESISLEGAGESLDDVQIVGASRESPTIDVEGEAVVIRFRNLTLRRGAGGLHVGGSAQVDLEDVRIADAYGSGLSLYDALHATLVDCEIVGNEHNGISLANSAGLSMRETGVGESGATGIAAATRGRIALEDCAILSNGACGIELRGSTRAELRAVEIAGNGSGEVQGGSDELLARSGVWLSGTSHALLEDCRIMRGYGIGVMVDESASLVGRRTEILGSAEDGLVAQAAADVELVDCEIVDAAWRGISLWGASHTEIRRTEIRGSEYAGVLAASWASAELYGCRITGNHRGGVLTYTSECDEDVEEDFRFHGMVVGVDNVIPGPDEAFGNTMVATCPWTLKELLCRETAAIDRTMD